MRSSFPSSFATRLVVSAGSLPRKGTSSHRGKSFSLREKLERRDATHQVRDKFSSASDSKLEFEQKHVGNATEVNSGGDENGLGSSLDFERMEEMHDDVVSKESALWRKMDSWVERYKRDNEFWGVGTSPIFVIYEDTKGNIVRVDVNEDEIVRRNQIKVWSIRKKNVEEEEDLQEEFGVSSRILRARVIAEYIKSGEYKIPRNSSIAKFLGEGERASQVDWIWAVISQGKKVMKLPPKLGFMILLGFVVLWVVKKSSFRSDDNRIEMTIEEKEMLKRKLKARRERSPVVKGSVEVLNNSSESKIELDKRPELDKDELMKNVLKAKKMTKHTSGKFEKKVEEIRQMARRVREFELEKLQSDNSNLTDMKVQLETKVTVDSLADVDTEETPNAQDSIPEKKHSPDVSLENPSLSSNNSVTIKPRIIRSVKEAREYLSRNWEISNGELHQPLHDSSSIQSSHDDGVVNVMKGGHTMSRHNEAVGIKCDMENVSSLTENSDKTFCLEKNTNGQLHESFRANEGRLAFPSDDPELEDVAGSKDGSLKLEVKDHSSNIQDNSSRKEITNIELVSESNSQNDVVKISNYNSIQMENGIPNNVGINEISNKECSTNEDIVMPVIDSSNIDIALDPLSQVSSVEPHYEDIIFPIEKNDDHSQTMSYSNDIFKDLECDDGKTQSNDNIDVHKCENKSKHESDGAKHSEAPVANNWLDENFDVCLPVIEKIRDGFRENYKIAKRNAEEGKIVNTNLNELGLVGNDDELEWMSDDKLRDIVFQVRDNELAGRDPFHSMTADDQNAFFNGLEKKADKMNTKLLGLHDYLHSRIENLNYGADGISVYDPIEKIVPRWKGPPVDSVPSFLNNPVQPQKSFDKDVGDYSLTNDKSGSKVVKSEEQTCTDGVATYSVRNLNKIPNETPAKPKTVIECSDGTSRAGKKGGKEHWQHTKKWSREFLELYNAETDPEVKSSMRDMGKGLDKWITEREINDAAELMKGVSKKKREFMDKKLAKLKREIETFGQQAVVSKYREYLEEKEIDYLWWLDLKFILCIELYTIENDAQKVGFYSLEVAEDLELNPKQYHIFAFENTGDAKNFCYIMQAHLEMLGKGNAFVVARPPKDAFRDARDNGFHVTVIRKGEIKLNIDQSLEAVEEELLEIGSKMYHDKILREHSIDINALKKGVFSSNGRKASSKSAKKGTGRTSKRFKKPDAR